MHVLVRFLHGLGAYQALKIYRYLAKLGDRVQSYTPNDNHPAMKEMG